MSWRRDPSWREEPEDVTSRTQWRLCDETSSARQQRPAEDYFDDDARLAWTAPDVVHPAEVPAWRLMEESLGPELARPARTCFTEALSTPWEEASLDSFERLAARTDAPLCGQSTAAAARRALEADYRRSFARDVVDEANEETTLTLTQVTETLDAALYTFTKSYQAKEQREKEAQAAVEKQRTDERLQIEKEVREAHSLMVLDGAVALEDVESARVDRPCCSRCCSCDGARSCPCFCFGHSTETEQQPLSEPDERPPEHDSKSLADATQIVTHELDLALAMMQKRLGKPFVGYEGVELVAKPPDAKPTDPVAATVETEDEKEKRIEEEKRKKQVEEFERRTRDAELRAAAIVAERAREFDDLGTPRTDDDWLAAADQVVADDRARDLDLATDEAIDRHLLARDAAAYADAGAPLRPPFDDTPRPIPRFQPSDLLLPDEIAFLNKGRLSRPPTLQPSRSHDNPAARPPTDPLAMAQTRLDHNRHRRRLLEAKGILDHTLDAREALAQARSLRQALSGELNSGASS